MGDSRRYFRILRKAALLNFTNIVVSRFDVWTYVPSKLIRMGFFFLFATSVFAPGTKIAGYTPEEALLFFAFMNFIDVVLQLFYRGLTDHPRIIKNGDFDFILTKPINPLWYCTFRIFDILDLITLPAVFAFLGYALWQWPGTIDAGTALITFVLVLCAFIIALCLNIMVAAIAFWSTETTNIHWIYRDLVYVSRFPPEVFPVAVRTVMTYIIPIFVIVSFPTKALLNRLSAFDLIWAMMATIGLVFVTNYVWQKGLRHYTSASS